MIDSQILHSGLYTLSFSVSIVKYRNVPFYREIPFLISEVCPNAFVLGVDTNYILPFRFFFLLENDLKFRTSRKNLFSKTFSELPETTLGKCSLYLKTLNPDNLGSRARKVYRAHCQLKKKSYFL